MKSSWFAPSLSSLVLVACSTATGEPGGGREKETGTGGAASPAESGGSGGMSAASSGGASAVGGSATGGERATGGTASGGAATGGTGGSAEPSPPSTTVNGIMFDAMPCGSAIAGSVEVVLSPDVARFGGWSHFKSGTFESNGLDASGLLSADMSVYDITDTTRTPEPDCGGEDTWRRTLARRVEGHTNKHPNGLQVRGTHPNLVDAESVVIDLRLEVAGTNIPAGIPDIHDGSAVLQIAANEDGVRIPIDPDLYLGHWIRITMPAAQLGTGVPMRLQFVAELSTSGIDSSRNDFEELDLNIYQIAYVMK